MDVFVQFSQLRVEFVVRDSVGVGPYGGDEAQQVLSADDYSRDVGIGREDAEGSEARGGKRQTRSCGRRTVDVVRLLFT
jgi:hypothetical protein